MSRIAVDQNGAHLAAFLLWFQGRRENKVRTATDQDITEQVCSKMHVDFEIFGTVRDIEIIAVGPAIRELPRLRRMYGTGRWRKMKGRATIRTRSGTIVQDVEIHWYEAHGIGKKEYKVKD